jgi:hypothetical protein
VWWKYYNSLADAKAKLNPITNANSFTNTGTNQSVFARVTNTLMRKFCNSTTTVSTIVIALQNPITTCDTDGSEDGLLNLT